MRSFFLLHNNVSSFFILFFIFYERFNDIATDWQTSLLRETRVWLCVPRPAQVVDKTAFFPNAGSNQPPWPRPRSCASQSTKTGWRQNIFRSSRVSLILLRLIWKCCVSGWELICSRVPDINLDRAGFVNIVNLCFVFFPAKSGNLAQPETVAHRPPEIEGTHAVSDICAVVHMVLVKCVWMPTPSYATKSRDVLESRLRALQWVFFLLPYILYLFLNR